MAREKPQCECFYCGKGDYVEKRPGHMKGSMVESTVEVDTHLLFGNAAHAHCHDQALAGNKSKYTRWVALESDTNAFKRVARWAFGKDLGMIVSFHFGERQ